jgi:two-component system, NtrC family, response regulator HydG
VVGDSEPVKRLLHQVQRAAQTDATVLVHGESGTGKELVARMLHDQSPRRAGPFIVTHCAALAETLLESELFGHERGAFTGAVKKKLGRFELADGGTIFLDELGEISPAVQTKLLRVLQEHEIQRVGGEETVKVDVRVVCATHRDLKAEVAAGRFREDLYYRLHVVPLELPPLRERPEDIGQLARHFIAKHAPRINARVTSIAQAAVSAAMPGPATCASSRTPSNKRWSSPKGSSWPKLTCRRSCRARRRAAPSAKARCQCHTAIAPCPTFSKTSSGS